MAVIICSRCCGSNSTGLPALTSICAVLAPGKRAPEEVQKIIGVGQRGGGVDGSPVLPEIALRPFGVQAAQARADDHPEFTGVVEADGELDAGRTRGGRGAGIEPDVEARAQSLEFRGVQRFASRAGRLAEDGRCRRIRGSCSRI